MSEEPLNSQAQKELGLALVNQLQVYLKSLHTYTANNTMVIRALDGLNDSLQEHFKNHPSDTLQIQLLPEETFFNNTLLPIALKDFERIRILTEDLRSLDIGEVVFDARVNQQSLSELAGSIHTALHEAGTKIQRSYAGIELNELKSSAAGSAQREAYQMCVWLFAGLLDGLDGFTDLVDEGRVPTLVPFMRHTRLVVDLAAERSVVLRHLCFARGDQNQESLSHLVACRTIISIQFLRSLGRNRSQLMAVGLASILDRTTAGTEPENVLKTLAPYSTLSDLAPRVMMTVRELERARRGQNAGPYGRTLYLVQRLVELIHGETPITYEQLQSSLRSEFSSSSDLVEPLLDWLGPIPIGCVMDHDVLGKVLVFDHGPSGDELRVAPIEGDTIGDVVNLGSVLIDTPLVFESRRCFTEEEVELEIEF
ncbi:MAG: hypothetical protein CL930_04150 [Deltaproteobacteria bacterium]|nr:hypothetical protein [Deltaproteobacteria bacterium]